MATKKPIFGDDVSHGEIYGCRVETRHLEEAASIKTMFPSYYDMVDEYKSLLSGALNNSGANYLNAVDIKRAQQLRSIGQRGLDIHAWSETYDGSAELQAAISAHQQLLDELIGSELGDMATEVLEYHPLTGVIFSFPGVGSLVELFLRLKNGTEGSGVVGIHTGRGLIIHGSENVGNFVTNNGIGDNSMMVYKESVGTGVLHHGRIHIKFNIAIALCYLHSVIINSLKEGAVIDIDGHVKFSSWFKNIMSNKIPFEEDIDALLGSINETKNIIDYWFDKIGSVLGGSSSNIESLKTAFNNCNIEPFSHVGYSPFGGESDELKFVMPGFDETATLDSRFQNLVRQGIDKVISGGKRKFGDTFGPGSKELLSNPYSIMNRTTNELISPYSEKGVNIIRENCGCLDDICGYNGSPNDVSIQKPSRYSETMGNNKEHILVYTWALTAHSCGLLNNCVYWLG